MGRILLFLISLAAISAIAYFYLTAAGRGHAAEAPAETLHNVRESAKNIEKDGMQRAEDIDHKTGNVP